MDWGLNFLVGLLRNIWSPEIFGPLPQYTYYGIYTLGYTDVGHDLGGTQSDVTAPFVGRGLIIQF